MPTKTNGKTGPTDQATEPSLVGALLRAEEETANPETLFEEVVQRLGDEATKFRNTAAGVVYEACVHLWRQDEPVNPVTVAEYLEETDQLKDLPDGWDYLRKLVENHVAIPDSADHFAQLIHEDYRQRQFCRLGQRMAQEAISRQEALQDLRSMTDESAGDSSDSQDAFPDPMADAAFHGPAGDLVTTIDSETEAAREAMLISFLTGVGNLMGDTVYIKVEEHRHPPRLNSVLVGPTSKARKGTADRHARPHLEALDPDWEERIVSGLSSGEGLISAVEAPDDEAHDPRLMVVEEELASTLKVLQRDGNKLSPIIRCAWDGNPLQVMVKQTPQRADDHHISIHAHVTATELRRQLDQVELANGFANRFLWIATQRTQVLPFGGDLSDIDFTPIHRRLAEAVDFSRDAGKLEWSKEAEVDWRTVYPELSDGAAGFVEEMLSRSEAQVLRLAVLYATLDQSRQITPPHLRAALAIWDYVEASVRWIFQDRTGNPLADRIAGIIQHQGPLNKTDLHRELSNNVSAPKLNEALEILASREDIETNQRSPEGPGRSATVYTWTGDAE